MGSALNARGDGDPADALGFRAMLKMDMAEEPMDTAPTTAPMVSDPVKDAMPIVAKLPSPTDVRAAVPTAVAKVTALLKTAAAAAATTGISRGSTRSWRAPRR